MELGGGDVLPIEKEDTQTFALTWPLISFHSVSVISFIAIVVFFISPTLSLPSANSHTTPYITGVIIEGTTYQRFKQAT